MKRLFASPLFCIFGLLATACASAAPTEDTASVESNVDAADAVKLIDAFTRDCPPVSGCTTSPGFDATIEVKNLGYEKKVEVVATTNGETWRTTSAHFVRSVGSGRELWAIESAQPVTQFAVAYTVGGRTYWDNNEGNDYRFVKYATAAFLRSSMLGAPTGALEGEGTASAQVRGFVFAQPAERTPALRVVYTDDGWRTVKHAEAVLAGRYDALDAWKYSLPVAATIRASDIEIAFELQHPRGTSWDNNYGLNYRIVNGKISH